MSMVRYVVNDMLMEEDFVRYVAAGDNVMVVGKEKRLIDLAEAINWQFLARYSTGIPIRLGQTAIDMSYWRTELQCKSERIWQP